MKWIYRYLDATLTEMDMGFYETELEAQIAANDYKSFGAVTSDAIEVADDYELFRPKKDK